MTLDQNTIQNSFWIAAALLFLFLVTNLFLGEPREVSKIKDSNTLTYSYEELNLVASSVLVWDIKHGEVLYEKNAEAQLPLASLTKMMTAVLAREFLADDGEIVVKKWAVEHEGDSGLLVGERWRVRDLIGLTLLTSSNDGAAALASAAASRFASSTDIVGIEEYTIRTLMNKKAKELGMFQTFFVNPSGLDIGSSMSGAYGSARDFALLLSYVLKEHPALFEATPYMVRTFTSLDGEIHNVENTHETIETLPAVIASKTGFTDLAGGNLAIIFEAGPLHPIAVIVLGSTLEGRFTDVEKLVWAVLREVSQEEKP